MIASLPELLPLFPSERLGNVLLVFAALPGVLARRIASASASETGRTVILTSHQNLRRRCETFGIGLVFRALVERSEKIENRLIRLQYRYLLNRGLTGHSVLDPTLEP